jgi:hypothetical protein
MCEQCLRATRNFEQLPKILRGLSASGDYRQHAEAVSFFKVGGVHEHILPLAILQVSGLWCAHVLKAPVIIMLPIQAISFTIVRWERFSLGFLGSMQQL